MRRIVFPYARLGTDFHPIVSLGIHLAGSWRTAFAYVDSGAAYTVLSTTLVPAGFDYRSGKESRSHSATGHPLSLFIHDIEIQVGPNRFEAPVAFSPDLHVGFNLLGRNGIFDRYRVEFNESKHIVSFAPMR